ncbi:uncharacterized protein LOC108488104 [Gossypium arboreum]|uniref:uncharacterized protein LOC108488104 n=1 Tax=Gossypium arboreum TaxID=29729 RepID=UPI0008190316|nr:uncharacterized protein LOC108488104 [Gossypium arboreum]
MYRDLRELYWFPGLKREVIDFVSKCLTCQQVKVEHQLPSGLLKPVNISLWKWERVTMDFVSELPLTPTKKDSKLAKLYVSEIVRLDGIPVSSIFDRDPRFTSQFWRKLHEALGTRKKSYADLKRKEIQYSVEDLVFLKVSSWKKLELPSDLDQIHNIFHISMLRRYRSDPAHIVSIEEIKVRSDLTFEEEPAQILDRDVKVLMRKSVLLVKVLWRNHSSEEAMWEPEEISGTLKLGQLVFEGSGSV